VIELAITYLKRILQTALKTCYNEVNVVMAEAKVVRSGSKIRTGGWTPGHGHCGAALDKLMTPPKVLPYFAHYY